MPAVIGCGDASQMYCPLDKEGCRQDSQAAPFKTAQATIAPAPLKELFYITKHTRWTAVILRRRP